MNEGQPSECVGSLLVHQSDMKELSEATARQGDGVECVGSLLVHSSDVQELSESSPALPAVNLKQRISVGTLLVTSEDIRSPGKTEGGVSIQKRITNKMTGPSPPDDEADTWAD
jgi:hypothetical protein